MLCQQLLNISMLDMRIYIAYRGSRVLQTLGLKSKVAAVIVCPVFALSPCMPSF